MLRPKKSVFITFLAPAVLFYLLVFLYPTIRTVSMSFFSVKYVSDPISTWRFNGLANYQSIFKSEVYIQSLKNIGRIWLFGGLGTMFFALIFAVTLTGNIKGKKIFRTIIYMPNVISAVAMGTMWLNYVYNSEYGLLHQVFKFFGMEAASNIIWTGPGFKFWAMLVAYCFGAVGYFMLIFISGIEQIPKDYYEAATIEGAGTVRRFFLVTAPFIRGVTRTNIVMWTVSVVGFFLWSQLFSPINLSYDTVAPVNYMYSIVFGSASTIAPRDSGAGAAIGVILVLIIIIACFVTGFIIRKNDTEV
jgi:multiple sugar transport system permease protein